MNTFLPSRYLERVIRGAVALQLWDGARDARIAAEVDVVIEREDPAEPQWARDQAIGIEDVDEEGRQRFPKRPTRRHAVNLHAILYGRQLPLGPRKAMFDVRIVDRRWRFSPRRLRVPVPTAPDSDTAGEPMMRIRRTALYPGAAYDLISGSTGIRGRVIRNNKPVRWPRVVVPPASGAAGDPPRAVAHGDHLGEFLLLIPPAAVGTLSSPAGTFQLPLTLGVPPALTAAQQRAIALDALADLRLESMAAAQAIATVSPRTAARDPIAMGWRFPGGYLQSARGPITFTAGRIHRELLSV